MSEGVWRYRDQVAFVDSGERVVVLDLTIPEDEPRILSESGSAIWRAVDGIRSDAEVVAEIARHYEIATVIVAPDVAEFLTELAALRLIVRAQPGA
jgi:hypothetical protein